MAKLDALLAASLLLAALWLHGVTLSCGAVQRWVPSTQRERWPQADDFVGLMGKRSYAYCERISSAAFMYYMQTLDRFQHTVSQQQSGLLVNCKKYEGDYVCVVKTDYSDDTFDGLMGRRSAKPVGAGHAGSPSYERFQDSGRARETLGRLASYLATSDRHPRINGSKP